MDEDRIIKDLFDTKERRAEAVLAFRGLLSDPGWKLLARIITQNITLLRRQLEEGTAEDEKDETLEEVKYKRKLLKAHRDFINTPQKMIDDFTRANTGFETVDELDPYEQREDLVAGRRNS